MKIKCFNFLLFLLTLTFLVVTDTYARNWILIEDLGLGKVMLDEDSVKRGRNANVTAQIKVVSFMSGSSDPKDVLEVITYYEFDCRKNLFRTTNPTYYLRDGSREKTYETSPWQDSNDTLTLKLKDNLCK